MCFDICKFTSLIGICVFASLAGAAQYDGPILPKDSSASQCRFRAQLEADPALSLALGSDSWSGTGIIECQSALSSSRQPVNVCYNSWYSKAFQHINLSRLKIFSDYIALQQGGSELLSEFEIKKVSEFIKSEDNSQYLQIQVLAWPGIKNYPMQFQVPAELENSIAFDEGALTVVKPGFDCSEGSE